MRTHVSCLALAMGIGAAASAQTPVGTGLTYQGRLLDAGLPAGGTYDLRFQLFDAATLGSPVGSGVCVDGVTPVDGLFTVPIDFGTGAFGTDARWIEIGIRSNALPGDCASGAYTVLSTRQRVTTAPVAQFALSGPGGGLWAASGSDIHNANAGNVGVGVSSPAHKLDVAGDARFSGRAAFGNDGAIGLNLAFDRVFDFSHTLSDFSSTSSWAPWLSVINIDPTLDLTAPNDTYIYSHMFWVEIPPGNPHDVQYLQGPYVFAGNSGTGSAEILAGAFISAQSSGDAVEHLGCEIGGWGYDSANLTNNYALSLRTGHDSVAGSIGNNYALYISTPEGPHGPIQNNIGIYMADQGAAGTGDNWAIYSDGGRSYFADGISIGATLSSPYKLVAVNDTDHAIFGKVEANSGAFGYGVYGQSDSASGGGGVFGIAPVYGVRGLATAAAGTAFGGYFEAGSPNGWAGYFVGRGHFSQALGIGTSDPVVRLQVDLGTDAALSGGGYIVSGGVSGANIALDNNEIMARNNGAAADLFINHDGGDVLIGAGGGAGNVGIGTTSPVRGRIDINVAGQRCIYGSNNSATLATAFFDNTGTGPAGVFDGSVSIIGSLSKSSGSFRIDHPLDPANKYLYHSFVESPDMMNIYNGNIVTDEEGYATIDMPEWFESLNRDFRYQLTVIGQFAQAIVSDKLHDGRFTIRTDKPSVEVSWQITGIRQDPWAEAHRIPVEQDKSELERGRYQHPELYGESREMGISHLNEIVPAQRANDANPNGLE